MAVRERIFEQDLQGKDSANIADLLRDGLPLTFLVERALLDHLILNTNSDIPSKYRSSKRLTLVATLWRDAAGISLTEFKRSGAYKSFSVLRYLLNYYDDLLDDQRDIPPSVLLRKLKFGEWDGGSMSEIVSDLISSTRPESVKSLEEKEDRQNLLRRLNEFRREQFKIFQTYEIGEKSQNISFDQAVCYRKETSGEVQRIMAIVLNTFFPRLSAERKSSLEDAFCYFGAAGQFVDDIADWWKDSDAQINIFSSALENFPEEKKAAWSYRSSKPDTVLSVFNLRRLAPRSTKLMDKYFVDFANRIPQGRAFDNFRRVLSIMYWVLPDVSGLTESKPLSVDKVRIEAGIKEV